MRRVKADAEPTELQGNQWIRPDMQGIKADSESRSSSEKEVVVHAGPRCTMWAARLLGEVLGAVWLALGAIASKRGPDLSGGSFRETAAAIDDPRCQVNSGVLS